MIVLPKFQSKSRASTRCVAMLLATILDGDELAASFGGTIR